MDILPIVNQALADVGLGPDDDPEFVEMLNKAAPYLTYAAHKLRNQLAVNQGPEHPGEIQAEAIGAEPPESGTIAYDIEAGIPVFVEPWPY